MPKKRRGVGCGFMSHLRHHFVSSPGHQLSTMLPASVTFADRDECLNGEILYSLKDAKAVIEQWRSYYNTRRPHSALGYRPPDPFTIAPPPALDGTANMQ